MGHDLSARHDVSIGDDGRRAVRTLLVLLALHATACASFLHGASGVVWPRAYDAAPITLTVVDAESHAPLAGVIAVAHWELEPGGEGYIRLLGQMMIFETVSDREGRVHFPGWGPKPRPLRGVLEGQSPEILLFLPGYVHAVLRNRWYEPPDLRSHRTSDWDQQTITLKRPASEEEYAAALKRLDQRFNSFPYDTPEWVVGQATACEWHEVPLLLTAVERERARLAAEGLPGDSLPRSLAARARQQSNADAAKCGRLADRLKETER
jgi:hypothetical protein